ncbi:diguanylate cyclase [Poseidonibacter lekithochrous]|uniref:diguanylate cyclase domain-containing protein n=1 Tax=Poseidonibacter TaxID=2321187 RepID=UPI001C089D2D|nr:MULTISPECIES: diguanylate cyclase [Poseidonibacter]MBU3013921.1 diguanylate cyclase [Poseidonibacter lekithochrous]MDO6827216.1 diguanylate cyclase [Poseidonibacter sp. 1_MG-2023]
MSIRFKFSFMIFVLLTSVFINISFIYLLEKYSSNKLLAVNNTHEIIIATNKLISHINDAETGQRGYLLTQNLEYLEPYHIGKRDLFIVLEFLTKQVQDEEQKENLENLKKLITEKFSDMQKTIDLGKNNQFNEAINYVKRGIGKNYMDQVKAITAKFIYRENFLLQTRKGNYKSNRVTIMTLMYVELTFIILFSLLAWVIVSKSFFEPLKLLLNSTKKVESGEKIDINEVTTQDEMGYLIANFYKMHEKILEREEHLSHIATHDTLTSLLNREKLYEYLDTSLQNANDTNTQTYVLFMDLNKFKIINDTFGHEAGDLMLQTAAKRFKSILREEDELFRIGGDEFLIVIQNIIEQSQIDVIIKKLLDTTIEPINYSTHKMKLSVSIGISSYPDTANNKEELIKSADIAMYEAKKNRKEHFIYFDKSMMKRESDKI